MRELNLVCHPRWMVDELQAAKGFEVKHSYGLDAVPLESRGLWAPQQYASDLTYSYARQNIKAFSLMAPGPEWLSTVPERFLKRQVQNTTLREVRSMPHAFLDGWWKAAEAKIDFLPNRRRTVNQLLSDARKLPDGTALQTTPSTIDIVDEYRLWVVEGNVLSGSLYLTNRSGFSETYYDGAVASQADYEAAVRFGISVLSAVECPPAFTLDVALTSDGSYTVLEANPAWCSAWYGADVSRAAEAVWRATAAVTAADSRWQWKPDPYHVLRSQQKRVLAF